MKNVFILLICILNESIKYRKMNVNQPKYLKAYQLYDITMVFLVVYSQLPPCGNLAITDTPLLRTAAKSPAKVTDV